MITCIVMLRQLNIESSRERRGEVLQQLTALFCLRGEGTQYYTSSAQQHTASLSKSTPSPSSYNIQLLPPNKRRANPPFFLPVVMTAVGTAAAILACSIASSSS